MLAPLLVYNETISKRKPVNDGFPIIKSVTEGALRLPHFKIVLIINFINNNNF